MNVLHITIKFGIFHWRYQYNSQQCIDTRLYISICVILITRITKTPVTPNSAFNLFDPTSQWFTPDGFRSLLALVGTNGQGIGTSAFSRWVKNVSALDLPNEQRIQVDKLIDRIYDEMDEGKRTTKSHPPRKKTKKIYNLDCILSGRYVSEQRGLGPLRAPVLHKPQLFAQRERRVSPLGQ